MNIQDCKGMQEMIPNRMTCLYLIYGSLCLINEQDQCLFNKEEIKEWVYEQQVTDGGFRGGPFLSFDSTKPQNPNDFPTLANTYCALCLLIMCGDYTFSRVNKEAIIKKLHKFQSDSGSFMVLPVQSETDVRFTYCATAISFMLNDFSGIDVPSLQNYILSCQGYQGGFSWQPYGESHAGLTYCALATLKLTNLSSQEFKTLKPKLVEFLILRKQEGGFQGRCNKLMDSCYSFWNKGSLDLLGEAAIVDEETDKQFLLECFNKFGGFSKYNISKYPDILHTFYSVAALSFVEDMKFQRVNSMLAIPQKDFEEFMKVRNNQ